MRMHAQTTIERPIEDVFAYLADVTNDVAWRDEIISAERTSDGPVAVGSTGRHLAQQGGRQLESIWTCTEYDPPTTMRWELDSGAYLGGAGYELRRTGEGTEFELDGEVRITGIMRLLSPLMERMGNRQLQDNAQNLKRILESAST